jgi:beta-lactamase superfamily II metal-dependent hydrolase
LEQLFGMDTLYTATNNSRSPAFRKFIAQFDRIPGRHKALRLNDTVAGWQVMHPGPADHWRRGEDNALVLRGRVGHATVLLLGNLGRDGQNSLLSRTNDLHADLVVAGMPGLEEPLCADLLRAIRPQAAVIADAKFPVSSRAKEALKSRLAESGIPVIYTQEAGTVTVVDQPQNWQLSTMDGRKYTFANAKE